MKTIKFLATLCIGLSIVSCKNQLKSQSSLNSELDSVSYALGLDMSGQMLQMKKNIKDNFNLELNKDLLIQGLLNGVDSTNLLMKKDETRTLLMAFFQKKQKEQGEKIKKEGEDFLAANKTKEGVKTTESGLQYIVLKEGKGVAPKATSKVKVNYHGTLIDGTVFDSSVDRGQPAEFGVSDVIKGWTEGLQLMKTGAKYKFFIPQELAYGPQQRGPKIKPFSPLIFEVELLEVK